MTCWLPSPRHGFCHGGLADIDAKLEQFAVDPRCSPKRFAMLMSRIRFAGAVSCFGFAVRTGALTMAPPDLASNRNSNDTRNLKRHRERGPPRLPSRAP